MEKSNLYTEKVAILSRLIKESSLSLEEALVLLKEEDVEKTTPVTTAPAWVPGTTTPWIQPYIGTTTPLIGSSGNIPFIGSSVTYTNTAAGNTTTTTAFLNTPSTLTADLNN